MPPGPRVEQSHPQLAAKARRSPVQEPLPAPVMLVRSGCSRPPPVQHRSTAAHRSLHPRARHAAHCCPSPARVNVFASLSDATIVRSGLRSSAARANSVSPPEVSRSHPRESTARSQECIVPAPGHGSRAMEASPRGVVADPLMRRTINRGDAQIHRLTTVGTRMRMHFSRAICPIAPKPLPRPFHSMWIKL